MPVKKKDAELKKKEEETIKAATELWSTVVLALDDVNAVIRGEKAKVDQQNISTRMGWYNRVFETVTNDNDVSPKLYEFLEEWIKRDLATHVTVQVQRVAEKGDSEELFKEVTQSYDRFRLAMQFGRLVFHYLDTFVAKQSSHHSIEKLYLMGFNRAVYQSVKKDLQTVIIRQVNSRRDGNTVEMAALKSAVGIFISVGTSVCDKEEERRQVYMSDIETAYLDALRKVYGPRAVTELQKDGGRFGYLEWVESRIDLELHLAKELLSKHYGSIDKVYKACDEEMAIPHAKRIIDDPECGFTILLETWKDQDLARMYKVFKRIPREEGLLPMARHFENRIVVEGDVLIRDFSSVVSDGNNMTNEKTLVDAIIALNLKYNALVTSKLGNDSVFHKARKTAFERVLSPDMTRLEQRPGQEQPETRKVTFAEVFASYCDALMRGKFKECADAETENDHLDQIVHVFSFIVEKDLFQEHYKTRLAKRLLQTTPNEDLERSLLEKLQRAMGKSFTHKMEGMLNDRQMTQAKNREFEDSTHSATGREQFQCAFEIQVLTAGHWPAYRADGLIPPPSLRGWMDVFTRYYKNAFSTRKLDWFHSLGSCQLKISFPKGNKDANATIYQAAILLIIDERGQATPAELAENLKLDIKVVKNHIATVHLAKAFQLLHRVDPDTRKAMPGEKTINDSHNLVMNMDYQSKLRKLQLPTAAAAASGGAGGVTSMDAEMEVRRGMAIDACMVRIMKSRRTLHLNELQDLVISQLSKLFSPQPKMIKKRLEDLITRGYIKRDDEDMRKFDYLA